MRLFKLFSLLVAMALASCSRPNIIKESDSEIILEQNTDFVIALPEDHRTGYTWTLNDSYNKETIEFINSVWHGNEKGVYYNFHSQKTGLCTLNFVCRKFTDTSDYKSFRLKIVSK